MKIQLLSLYNYFISNANVNCLNYSTLINQSCASKILGIGLRVANIFKENTLKILGLQSFGGKNNCCISQFQVHAMPQCLPITLF